MGKFKEVKGIISRIESAQEGEAGLRDGEYVMQVIDGENQSIFNITQQTFCLDCRFSVGDHVFGYYRSDRPMILIYPPRYDMVAFGLVKEGRNVILDTFDQQLTSSDGMLRLNISELTWIENEVGEIYCDNIENKDLLVLYGASTRSIPAATVPTVIFVMNTEEMASNDNGTLQNN